MRKPRKIKTNATSATVETALATGEITTEQHQLIHDNVEFADNVVTATVENNDVSETATTFHLDPVTGLEYTLDNDTAVNSESPVMRKPRKIKTSGNSVLEQSAVNSENDVSDLQPVANVPTGWDVVETSTDNVLDPNNDAGGDAFMPVAEIVNNDNDIPAENSDPAADAIADEQAQAANIARLASRAAVSLSKMPLKYPSDGISPGIHDHLAFLSAVSRLVGRRDNLTTADIIDAASMLGCERSPGTRGGYRYPSQHFTRSAGIFNGGGLSVLRDHGLVTPNSDRTCWTITDKALTHASYQRGQRYGTDE